ncbi:MAG TPA: LEA type 2 family protein [Solirubrobacterales bacterium]|nr:LEA type 2 family protein [Solirubrobacterales bacterium]
MSGAPSIRYRRAARAIIALAVAVACLGGVAFAATGLDQAKPAAEKPATADRDRSQGDGPPRPSLIEAPAAVGVDPDTQFRFHVAPQQARSEGPGPSPPAQPATRWRRFECRTDGEEWSSCSSPHVLAGLDTGLHTFAVRALNRRDEFGKAAHYRWTQLEPMEFTIDPEFGPLAELMPGDPAQQLPVRISNPNPAPIEVTGLTASIVPDQPACAADPNFEVTPAGLTAQEPLSIPAGGSATLPSPGAAAPTLALRDLPVDQNACQGAALRIVFSGQARG